jgi:hypothetical protein
MRTSETTNKDSCQWVLMRTLSESINKDSCQWVLMRTLSETTNKDSCQWVFIRTLSEATNKDSCQCVLRGIKPWQTSERSFLFQCVDNLFRERPWHHVAVKHN